MPRLTTVLTPIVLIALGGMGLATAQSSSPFASKKKQQAWETPQATPSTPAPYAPAAPSAPTAYGSATPNYAPPASAPSYPAPSYSNPSQISSDAPIATTAPIRPTPPSSSTPVVQYGGGSSLPPQGTYVPPQGRFTPPTSEFGRPGSIRNSAPNYDLAGAKPAAPTAPQGAPQYGGPQYNPQYQPNTQTAQAPYPPQGTYTPPQSGPTSYPAPQEPQSWTERLGLKNIKTYLTGGLRAGAAATYRDVAPNQIDIFH